MSEKNWPKPFAVVEMVGATLQACFESKPKKGQSLYTTEQVREILAAEVAVEREACAKIGDVINPGTWAIEEYQERIRERGSRGQKGGA